jgi:hypothetical protein
MESLSFQRYCPVVRFELLGRPGFLLQQTSKDPFVFIRIIINTKTFPCSIALKGDFGDDFSRHLSPLGVKKI